MNLPAYPKDMAFFLEDGHPHRLTERALLRLFPIAADRYLTVGRQYDEWWDEQGFVANEDERELEDSLEFIAKVILKHLLVHCGHHDTAQLYNIGTPPNGGPFPSFVNVMDLGQDALLSYLHEFMLDLQVEDYYVAEAPHLDTPEAKFKRMNLEFRIRAMEMEAYERMYW